MTEKTELEVWYYAGKRLVDKGKSLADCWYTESDLKKPMLFSKFPAHRIGDAYDVQVARDGDTTSVLGSPIWLDRRPATVSHQQLVLEWTARDRSDRVNHRRLRDERRGDDAILSALDELRPLFKACRTHTDRTALIATVIDQLYRM